MSDEPYLARTKSFTCRSRSLSPALAETFTSERDKYVVDVPRSVGTTSVAADHMIDLETLFGRRAPLIVEVGAGRGEQIVASAKTNPGVNFLAFEVWLPGLARLVAAASLAGLHNVKVVEADAQHALKTILPPSCVNELWTFFPDPWRKKRHHKRRLVSADFADTVCGVLEDGGLWRLATDWENYAQQMLRVIQLTPELENPALGDSLHKSNVTGGFVPRFKGRVQTHFEQRGTRAGRTIFDLTAVRVPRQPGQNNASTSFTDTQSV